MIGACWIAPNILRPLYIRAGRQAGGAIAEPGGLRRGKEGKMPATTVTPTPTLPDEAELREALLPLSEAAKTLVSINARVWRSDA